MKRLFLVFLALMLTAILSEAADYYRVTADKLNVRMQPSKNGKVVGSVQKGQVFKSNEENKEEGWIYIEGENISGYVSSEYMRFCYSEEDVMTNSSESLFQKLSDKLNSIEVPYFDERIMTFIIVLLLIIQLLFVKLEFRNLTWVAVLLLILLSVAELYYIFMDDVDVAWFCERFEVGWFGCIIGFLGFALFLYGQFIAILETLGSINISSGVRVNWIWGILAWGIGIIAAMVLSIFDADVEGLGVIFIIYQLGFCIYVLIANILEKQILSGILYPLFYLLIMIPFSALLAVFLGLVVIVAIILLIGGALLGGSSSGRSGGGNVTLEDGTELYETGIDTYRDHNGNYWSRNGDRFTREDN